MWRARFSNFDSNIDVFKFVVVNKLLDVLDDPHGRVVDTIKRTPEEATSDVV